MNRISNMEIGKSTPKLHTVKLEGDGENLSLIKNSIPLNIFLFLSNTNLMKLSA